MEKVIRRKPLGSSLIFYSLERIIAFSERGNSALQHVMESNGFQQKGVLRHPWHIPNLFKRNIPIEFEQE